MRLGERVVPEARGDDEAEPDEGEGKEYQAGERVVVDREHVVTQFPEEGSPGHPQDDERNAHGHVPCVLAHVLFIAAHVLGGSLRNTQAGLLRSGGKVALHELVKRAPKDVTQLE